MSASLVIPTEERNGLLASPARSYLSKVEHTITESNEYEPSDNSKYDVHQRNAPRRLQKRSIYWLIPTTAALLFLLGLLVAIGHYTFLSQIEHTTIDDQTWTLRYSLAFAYVFKSALAASISIAIAQHVWAALRRSERGTPVQTIDAMFASATSILSFLSPSLWGTAFSTGLMAACIWLMPLTALVAPTALTVGTSIVSKDVENCIVPTLDWSIFNPSKVALQNEQAGALTYSNYEGSEFSPSTASQRLTAAVADTSRQNSWQSPCGTNCTYNISFIGPSWQCVKRDVYTYPQSNVSRWPSNLNHKITMELEGSFGYDLVYQAGLDVARNTFSIGYASGLAQYILQISPHATLTGMTVGELFDIHEFSCQIANTSYAMRVDYINGVQHNTVLQAEAFQTFEIASQWWQGLVINQNLSPALQEVIGMFKPVMATLSGTISGVPQQTIGYATQLGMITSLTTPPPSNLSTYIAPQVPYLPRLDLGPLLQELSYNLTISLMSYPDLLVTSKTTVPCTTHLTNTVWKFERTPLVTAYSIGLFATLVCLAVGCYALVSNGVAHDTSFSSVVRTTRNQELDGFAEEDNVGALPLSRQLRKQRLRFLEKSIFDDGDGQWINKRDGFVPVK